MIEADKYNLSLKNTKYKFSLMWPRLKLGWVRGHVKKTGGFTRETCSFGTWPPLPHSKRTLFWKPPDGFHKKAEYFELLSGSVAIMEAIQLHMVS